MDIPTDVPTDHAPDMPIKNQSRGQASPRNV
jgi:hypothetical protein